MSIRIEIAGYGEIELSNLQEDVNAAIEKGLTGKYAFCPETVQGLIDKIYELNETSGE